MLFSIPPRPTTFVCWLVLLGISSLARGQSLSLARGQSLPATTLAAMRAPATPLVVHDPYFSIWSMADELNAKRTVHWTGKPNRLNAYLRIDGHVYRVMGGPDDDRGQNIPNLSQKTVRILPTRTIYEFSGSGINLMLTFLTPALPDDLDVLSRPLTYIQWSVASSDGSSHETALLFEVAADVVVNTPDEKVVASRYELDGFPTLRMGSQSQPVLEKAGDDLRIDWGYVYLAPDKLDGMTGATATHRQALQTFGSSGHLENSDDLFDKDRGRNQSSLAMSLNLGAVTTARSRYLMLAYDDQYSIEYLQRKERPWWRRNGAGAADLLRLARNEHDSLEKRSERFDQALNADLTRVGGERYAQLSSLAYRQSLGAYKLVADVNGHPLFFPKENFSNGCIATVDVIYPAAPLALLFNPILLEAQLRPVLEYAQMPRWKWPFAPHDLGTYPLANGQVYGGGELTEENQMPVEESGNMLILLAALAKAEGNADFARPYWPQLTRWAEYLKEKGLDPENQLSTDDFAGHLAHNANLSIKAILALASYGKLAGETGHGDAAREYTALAKRFAEKWRAMDVEGDHYKLAFDQPGSWSQKYNLVWDKLLGLKIFPAEIARQEMAFYKQHENKYGLPLDSRRDYTKLDWLVWTATLSDDKGEFEELTNRAADFLNNSTSRVPMTDWYDTKTAKQEGFQARSVVGGVFIKMLADDVWAKYVAQAQKSAGASHD